MRPQLFKLDHSLEIFFFFGKNVLHNTRTFLKLLYINARLGTLLYILHKNLRQKKLINQKNNKLCRIQYFTSKHKCSSLKCQMKLFYSLKDPQNMHLINRNSLGTSVGETVNFFIRCGTSYRDHGVLRSSRATYNNFNS